MDNSLITAILLMILMSLMTAGGQVLIKLGLSAEEHPSGLIAMARLCLRPFVFGGLILTLLAPLVYLGAVSRLGLSGAYGLNGITYFVVFLFSRIFLMEKSTVWHLAGLTLIAAGVTLWSI